MSERMAVHSGSWPERVCRSMKVPSACLPKQLGRLVMAWSSMLAAAPKGRQRQAYGS